MSNEKNGFKKIIGMANSGKRFPVMSLVRNDPGLASVLSKMIVGPEAPTYGTDGSRQPVAPNIGAFKGTSERIAQNISDAQTVMQILPDMELTAQILVASTLAPKDMMTTELTYSAESDYMAPDVSAAMLARVRQHFEQDYKIKPLLTKMLRDVLFEKGSYAVAVIPENSIDDVINGSHQVTMEALAESLNLDGSIKPLGLLGPAVKKQPTAERRKAGLSLESYQPFDAAKHSDIGNVTLETLLTPAGVDDTYLTVTDNPNLLKIPRINQKIRENRIQDSIGSKAMESMSSRLNDREMTGLIYKDRNFAYKPISVLKTQEQLNRHTVGNPLVLHLPSESVIPVHVPGCVEEQIGFFVLIDADGNPVSSAETVDHYQELSSRLSSSGSFPSAMLNKVKGMMSGFDINNRDHMDYSARAYGSMVEQDLLARLRNGVYGNGVALAKTEEVYRIMFARALAKQHTQLLFLPVELMTYFAFKYTPDGVGKSILDDMKILNSLRAMLKFANVMASLKNSIGRTEVKIKLDESDPNPQKTIEIAQHEIIRSRQQQFPLGMNNPNDLVDWLGRSGFEFTYEGHPGIPDVGVDFGEKSSNYVKPDTDLEELLRKEGIMAAGLPPQVVDASFEAEFATSVVTNNIMMSKRVVQIQDNFTPQLSNHMRKHMMNSEKLIRDLREILLNNFDKLKLEKREETEAMQIAGRESDDQTKEARLNLAKQHVVNQFMKEFMGSFQVGLPKPNSVTLENQLTALETYIKALDAGLDAWISDKFFTNETGGEVATQVATVKEVLKAFYIRKWMAENGVMTELADLTMEDSEGKPVMDMATIQTAHLVSLTKSMTELFAKLKPIKDASDTVMNAIGGAGDAPAATGDDSGGGTGDDTLDEGGGAGGDAGLDTDTVVTDPDADPAAAETPAAAADGVADPAAVEAAKKDDTPLDDPAPV